MSGERAHAARDFPTHQSGLQKPEGGVRGIVVGDVVRRLVATTLAKQFGSQAEAARHPIQYALSTGARCASADQSGPRTTVLSIGGVGASDTGHGAGFSRHRGWGQVDRQSDNSPSSFLWEQGEGGEGTR